MLFLRPVRRSELNQFPEPPDMSGSYWSHIRKSWFVLSEQVMIRALNVQIKRANAQIPE